MPVTRSRARCSPLASDAVRVHPFDAGFWQRRVYTLAIATAAFFVVATLAAMALYPGGSFNDRATVGYLFTRNFFSDLGMLTAHNGASNLPSMTLFFSALSLSGGGLVLFFLAFPRLFADSARARRWSMVGSLFGVIAGAGYVGVAFTPADLLLDAHIACVKTAAYSFPVAALCCAVAIFRSHDYPHRYAWVFVAFAAALVGYVLLLEFGPKITTDAGLAVQVGGQKLIVFGTVASVLVQAIGARAHVRARAAAAPFTPTALAA